MGNSPSNSQPATLNRHTIPRSDKKLVPKSHNHNSTLGKNSSNNNNSNNPENSRVLFLLYLIHRTWNVVVDHKGKR